MSNAGALIDFVHNQITNHHNSGMLIVLWKGRTINGLSVPVAHVPEVQWQASVYLVSDSVPSRIPLNSVVRQVVCLKIHSREIKTSCHLERKLVVSIKGINRTSEPISPCLTSKQ